MNREPLVTIILPAYNAVQYIDEAVQSVIGQTYSNWELIIINDGSKDGTDAYLQTLQHPSIRVFHQKNKGVSVARNVGLSIANGDLITFLDADDALSRRSLEVRADYLSAHPQVDIVDGLISVRDDALNNEKRSYRPYYQGLILTRLLKLDERVFFGPFYMFRRSLLGETKFSEKMTHAEDLLFFITLASRNNINYGHVNELVYLYRSSVSSAMSNMEGLEEGYFELLDSVMKLNGISISDVIFLRLRIARILLLSWRTRGRLNRGIAAAYKVLLV